MGRQVNFFMAKEDEQKFLSFAKATGDVVLLPAFSPTSSFPLIDRLPEPFSTEFWRQFWLSNRSVTAEFAAEFIPERGCYSINGFQSNVIEFSRSYVKDNTMFPGRIWAEFTVIDEESGDLAQKNREFRRWYETLAKWIRKEFFHTGWMIFAGPGALRFQDEGGTLP